MKKWKIKKFFFNLSLVVRPHFWLYTGGALYSQELEEWFFDAIEKDPKIQADNFHVSINGVRFWIENYPYASGDINVIINDECRKYRISRYGIYCLDKLVNAHYMSDEQIVVNFLKEKSK